MSGNAQRTDCAQICGHATPTGFSQNPQKKPRRRSEGAGAGEGESKPRHAKPRAYHFRSVQKPERTIFGASKIPSVPFSRRPISRSAPSNFRAVQNLHRPKSAPFDSSAIHTLIEREKPPQAIVAASTPSWRLLFSATLQFGDQSVQLVKPPSAHCADDRFGLADGKAARLPLHHGLPRKPDLVIKPPAI